MPGAQTRSVVAADLPTSASSVNGAAGFASKSGRTRLPLASPLGVLASRSASSFDRRALAE